MKALIITADDFGYAPAYDRGILEAVSAGALDAVAVMVGRLEAGIEELVETGVKVGLHLELDPAGEGWEPRSDVGRQAATGALVAQLDRLEALLGHPAAFLNGHHHCHALPGVAAALARVAIERGLWVRSVDARHRRLLRCLGVDTPDLLVGRYAETQPVLPEAIASALEGGGPDGVVEWMTHPGQPDPSTGSAYDRSRAEDLRVLLDLATEPELLRLRRGEWATMKT